MTRAPRYRYLLDNGACEDIRSGIETILAGSTPVPTYRAQLVNILTELEVAEARTLMNPQQAHADRLARRAPSDTIPVLLSDSEAAIINSTDAMPRLQHPAHTRTRAS